MNLFTLTGEILLRGADEAQSDIKDVTSTAENAESKMVSAFKKIGTVVAGAFAIDKIKDFGVAIVEASATVNAEMAGFEQIMGDYSDTAQAKLNEVADNTGIVSTRLTPYMTSLTAKFKGLGNGIEESTDLATRGLTLASDASAFWDKSLDDSMSALNSFINGSYEGGEAIGLFANDTQLASYAISQGIVEQAKDWANLDEKTKQATRLEYAENMMALSGATGQAKNESDSYANVQANLAEKWRQFKAQIGEPLLQNVVIPAMEKLSGVVDTLSQKYDQLKQWIADNQKTIDKWVDVLIIAGTIVATFVLAMGAMAIVNTVRGWITNAGTSFSKFNDIIAKNKIAIIITLIATLVMAFIKAYNESETFRNIVDGVLNAVVGFFQKAWDAIKLVWDAIAPYVAIVTEELKTRFTTMWNGIKEVWDTIQPYVSVLWEGVKALFNSAWEGIKLVWDAVQPYFLAIWDGIKIAFSVVGDVLGGFFSVAWTAIKVVWDVAESYFSTIWEVIKGTFSVVESVLSGDFEGAWNAIKGIWNAVEGYFKDVWEGIKKIFSKVDEELGGFFSKAWTNIKDAWSGVKEWFKGIWNGIKTTFGTAKTTLGGYFSSAWTNIKSKWSGVKKWFSDLWEDIKNVFDPSEFLNIGKNLVQGLWDGINSLKDWAVEKASGVWNSIKNTATSIFDTHSPSKVFEDIGRFIMEGLGLGIVENEDIGTEAIENTGESVISSVTDMFSNLGDKMSSSFTSIVEAMGDNPITRRIAQAFGFEFAEAIEESVPEVEESMETVEDAVDKGGKKISFAFLKNIKELASNALTHVNTALSYLTPMFDSFADLKNTELGEEAKAIEGEIEALNKATDEKLELAQKEHDAELELLQDKYEQGLISMSYYSAQKKALDKDLTSYKEAELKKEEEAEKKLAEEKNRILEEQFNAKKKNDKANIFINLATAIMKAYAELGTIGGSIASGVLMTTSANQIKTIDAQKFTPAFAEGGIVEDATYGLLGEDGREAVVPLENNTEWVGGLARAISPAIVTSSQSNSKEVATLREELRDIRMMLSEYLSQLLNKNTDIVLNGESLAYALAPSIDTNLGDINRLRARGI